MQLSFAFFLSLVALVAAASDSASCGKTQYTTNAINRAADASCSYIKKGTTVGTNNYPHEYKNLEKFSLQGLSGPFFEFPVLANGQIYSGGSPGPDRVVLTQDCKQAGVLTHQGANGNAFLECEVKSASVSTTVLNSLFAFSFCFAAIGYALAA
ncbi:Ribonuclease/ribotoxin [Moelleriella libera RCEF 2490]|uniref:ribonuclease T1 n=1 Tax=Moelleriella libera RCEF 2490 TaxID=1081109 RepID=A0A167VRZ5_9HYPO|nr:Ribonuclease/ribotoxin [Moelleriella libera RCEF 2490]